jgi:hypothetical protein
MMDENKKKPAGVYLLYTALLFQGLSGVAGGIGLVFDPTGKNLGIPQVWLEGSPFSDFLIPGLILLLVLGVFPLVVLYGMRVHHSMSWSGAFIVSIALIIWIIVEILVIGYQPQPPLQLIYGVLGLIILFLVLLPSVREYLGK